MSLEGEEDTCADKFFAQGEEDGLSQNDALTDDEFERHVDWINYKHGYMLGREKRKAIAAPEREEIAQTLEATPEKLPSGNGAVKFDTGKAPMAQGVIRRFPLALQQIALISEYGQRKYGTYDGWEKLDDALNRYTNAGARHDNLVASEGEYDTNDSGLPHRGQKAWNALAELELALREGIVEMTPGNEIVDGKPVLGSNGRKNDVIK